MYIDIRLYVYNYIWGEKEHGANYNRVAKAVYMTHISFATNDLHSCKAESNMLAHYRVSMETEMLLRHPLGTCSPE